MDQSESGKSQNSVLIESLALSNVTRKYLKHLDPSPEVKHLDLFGKFICQGLCLLIPLRSLCIAAASLYSPPFRSSVLEPSLDLGIGHLQVFGHLCALSARKVFLRKQSIVIRKSEPTTILNTCLWNLFSNSQIWSRENEVLGFFLLGGVLFW